MTTEEGLLAAIVANPDDDLPRLAYCDWLEENEDNMTCRRCKGREDWMDAFTASGRCVDCHGGGYVTSGRRERAEFIRTQIELDKPCTACKGAGEYDDDHGGMMTCRGCWGKKTMRNWAFSGVGHVALLNREKELWNESRLNGAPHPWVPVPARFKGTANWLSSHDTPRIGTIHRGTDVIFELRRGFVETVTCTLANWIGEECRAVNLDYPGERCDGGRVTAPNPQFTRECGMCRGTGLSKGCGPSVVSAHPIREVNLIGAVRTSEDVGSRNPFVLFRAILGPLWDFCDSGPGQVMIRHPDRDHLQKLVNQMALLWARREATKARPLTK